MLSWRYFLGLLLIMTGTVQVQASPKEVFTYEAAKHRVFEFLKTVPESPYRKAVFGLDLTAITVTLQNWSRLGASIPATESPEQLVLMEMLYRYFGERSGADLDLVAMAFDSPVYEGVLFEDGRFPVTFEDEVLRARGLKVRSDYVAALAKLRASGRTFSAQEWGRISGWLGQAFEWMSNEAVMAQTSRSTVAMFLEEGNHLASLQESVVLKLTQADEEGLSDLLYQQFNDAFRRWRERIAKK